ncbi:MAG: hypothetical protein HND48_11085 [Chloroflexi bacterium]|nr:hypothetical protein [Chloroflexota bacterium]
MFSATVDTSSINLSAPATGNSIIEVAHGDTLTVTYNDEYTTGGPSAQRTHNISVAFTTTPDGFTLIETAPVLREADFDLTWNAATDAAVYRVLVTQTSTNTRLGVYIDTAVETADVCAAGLCTYSVVGSIPGQFSWTVVALRSRRCRSQQRASLLHGDPRQHRTRVERRLRGGYGHRR